MAKAHIYLQPGANVEATDTFASWVDTTNQLINEMGTSVVTTVNLPQPNTSVGGYTSGNSHVEGLLSANTLIAATALRGGTVSTKANLVITSNTVFNQSALVQIDANTDIFSVNSNNAVFTSNVAISNTAKTFTISAANTTINAGSLIVNTNSYFQGAITNVTSTTLSATSNTTITASSLNANVDIITLGFNSSDLLNVNSISDFNANVNIDGVLTTTANVLFTGTQSQFDNNVIIGSSIADSFTVNSYLVSDLLPSAITVDLGSDAKPYGNVHTTYVYADLDIEAIGEMVLKGTTNKTIRVTGSDGTYKSLNLTFSNNSVSNTAIVANTSGLFGGVNQLYSLGSSSVNWKELYVQNSFVTGDQIVTGDISVNGGDITTSATTFNLLNTTATALNVGGAATTITVGAITGSLTINNPTVVGTQTTQNLWNTTATTVNAFGAAAAINVGATTGTATINNPTVVGSQATVNLWNTTSTAVNAFGAATTLNLGNVTGAQTLTLGGSSTGASTYNIGTGATLIATTKALNIGTGGATGSTTNVNIGSSIGGTTTLNSATIVGSVSTVNLWNTGATTVNTFGAATAISMGAATGTTTINNNAVVTGDIAINGGDITTSATAFNLINSTATSLNIGNAATAINIGATTGTATINNPTVVGSQTTANLWNTVSTTINAFGAATAINIGAATGTTTINNNAVVTGDITINGGDITTSATTFNLLNSTATSLNIGNAASTISIGATTGTATINNPTVVGSQTSVNLWNTGATTVNAFGAATAINIGAATGNTTINNNAIITGDVAVNGGDITTSATTFNLINATTTTLNIGNAATALSIGATTGILTVRNPTVVGTQTTQNLWNTTATTVNAFGAANTINIGGGTTPVIKIGTTNSNSTLIINANTSGTSVATIDSNIAAGTFAIAPSITTGVINVGSANTGSLNVLYTGSDVNTPATNALRVYGGAHVEKDLKVVGNIVSNNSLTVAGSLTVNGLVTFNNSDISLSANTSSVNYLTINNSAVFGANARLGSDMIPSANNTYDLGKTGSRFSTVFANNVTATTLSSATVSASGAVTGATITGASIAAASGAADSIVIIPGSGGANRTITISPPTIGLSANVTLSLANGNTVLQTGTMAITSGTLAQFGSTTSSQLAGVITDETGSGALVFSTSPTLVTPILGVASATTINKLAITTPATGSTLTIANGKTATINNTLTLTGTDASSVAFGTGGTVAYVANKLSAFAATTSAELAGVISDETGTGSLVFATSPTFSGNTTFNNVVVSGNLTIDGTITTINSTTISVDDKNIELGSVTTPTNLTADGGGITLKGTTDKTFNWVNATSAWTSSEDLDLLTGKVYEINGATVLSATTLGSGITGSSLTSVGTIGTGTWNATEISANRGGTGQTSYVVGDILYASSTSALSKLADVATGNSLISGGVGVAPSWGKIGLTTHVSGTLSITNGGTGQTTQVAAFDALSPTTTLGDIDYRGASNNLRLSGNITATKQFLSQTGTGTVSAAPSWSTVTKSDVGLSSVENTALSTWAGSTNVTTLGTIGAGTWNATAIVGQYGGTGVNNAGKTITLGGNLTTVGAFSTTLTSTAITAVTLPTSGTLSTLNGSETLTLKTLTAPTINAGTLSGIFAGTPTFGSVSFSGNTSFGENVSITGSITSGTWNATTISADKGGTGQSLYNVGDILYASSTSALSKLADVTTGNSLISGGVNVAPSWGKIGLTTHVSGTLSITNGGTGQTAANTAFSALSPLTTLGDTIYHSGVENVRLGGNITAVKQFLSQTGTGTVSAVPAWSALTKSDVGLSLVENTALSTWAGSANITTLGTIGTGTWNATTISVAKGGTGQTSYTDGQILIGNSTGNTLTKASITQGQNISITAGAGSITIAASNTNLSFTAGSTSGPTITSSTGNDVVIPSASNTASGIVTTGAQTFAGIKTFNSIIIGDISGIAESAKSATFATTADRWSTARTITIGDTGKTLNGSANVAWTLIEVGAADRNITITGTGSLTGGGALTASRTINIATGGVDTAQLANAAVTSDKLATTPSERAWVSGRIAGAALGDVGTYAFLRRSGVNTGIIAGTLYNASQLRYSGVNTRDVVSNSEVEGTNNTQPPGGTGSWMAMGSIDAVATVYAMTLFLRVV